MAPVEAYKLIVNELSKDLLGYSFSIFDSNVSHPTMHMLLVRHCLQAHNFCMLLPQY